MVTDTNTDRTDTKAINWNSMAVSFAVIHAGKETGMAGLRTTKVFCSNTSRKKAFPNPKGMQRVGCLGTDYVFLRNHANQNVFANRQAPNKALEPTLWDSSAFPDPSCPARLSSALCVQGN